ARGPRCSRGMPPPRRASARPAPRSSAALQGLLHCYGLLLELGFATGDTIYIVVRPHQRRHAPVSLEPRPCDVFGFRELAFFREKILSKNLKARPGCVVEELAAREARLRKERAVGGVCDGRAKARLERRDQALARHGADLAAGLVEQSLVARRRSGRVALADQAADVLDGRGQPADKGFSLGFVALQYLFLACGERM